MSTPKKIVEDTIEEYKEFEKQKEATTAYILGIIELKQKYIDLRSRFNATPTLCDLLQLVSYDTWRRIEFARTRAGLKIFETTITQNILYDIYVYRELHPTIHRQIEIWEADDEAKEGNDIELIIQTSQERRKYLLQAKIISRTNDYKAMGHRNQNGEQIIALIEYAERVGGTPLYLLYNYYPDEIDIPKDLCGIQYSKEQFGCSLVDANDLRNYTEGRKGNLKRKKPTFKDLHPSIAVPWFVLGCCRTTETNNIATANLFNKFHIGQKNINYKNEKPIKENKWKPLEIQGLNYSKTSVESSNTEFSPKYRIVLRFDE